MRKSLIACLIWLVSAPAFAQLKMGINVGPAASSISEVNSLPNLDSANKPYYQKRNSIYAGVFATMPINKKKNLVFQTGIGYQAMGNKFLRSYDTLKIRRQFDTAFVDSKFNTNYINIPINIAYSLKLGKKSSFNISAGPHLSLYLNGSKTYSLRTFERYVIGSTIKVDSVNKIVTIDSAKKSSVRFKSTESGFEVGKGSPKLKVIDLGYNVRVFFDLGGVFITGFYSESFNTFYRAEYSGTFKHRYIGGSFGIWLNKKSKEAKQ
jgi:OmpA-OmpF porin, OOP family